MMDSAFPTMGTPGAWKSTEATSLPSRVSTFNVAGNGSVELRPGPIRTTRRAAGCTVGRPAGLWEGPGAGAAEGDRQAATRSAVRKIDRHRRIGDPPSIADMHSIYQGRT